VGITGGNCRACRVDKQRVRKPGISEFAGDRID
jgi:hypothetical protein